MQEESFFDRQRSYLFAIAYRMLGSAADADDMVQEAWLRWQRDDRSGVSNPRGYLAGVVTRLCLDRLRELKRRREEYVGPWLPEPLLTQAPADGGELAESLSLAFLTMLERLTPVERAVFLLRQVFGYEYAEIAAIVGKSEANCRQQFSRAQKAIAEARPRFETSREAQQRMLQGFLEAVGSGDLSRIESILREDVEFISDGGGKAVAARRVLHGRSEVAKFLHGLAHRSPEGVSFEFAPVNGQLGLLLKLQGRLETVFVIESVDGAAQTIRAIRNPDKLARIG
ncbi:MAG: ECF RNA polymerase sigma factor SigJ [Planctomycetes bacterium]|nr:ECF RNA polymerase sigma factor SigJ [Planctomycetota bacterium]